MKVGNRKLLILYLTAFCLFTICAWVYSDNAEIYWMHDVSITVTKQKLLVDILLFFLMPATVIFSHLFRKIQTPIKLFLFHFLVSLISVLILFYVISLSKNTDYGFINAKSALVYYLSKMISLVTISIIIIRGIFFDRKSMEVGQGGIE
jgi:hypothetical protein